MLVLFLLLYVFGVTAVVIVADGDYGITGVWSPRRIQDEEISVLIYANVS